MTSYSSFSDLYQVGVLCQTLNPMLGTHRPGRRRAAAKNAPAVFDEIRVLQGWVTVSLLLKSKRSGLGFAAGHVIWPVPATA